MRVIARNCVTAYRVSVRLVREVEIGRALRAEGIVSVEALAERLSVSASTIRRDLERLERRRELMRVHGGAALVPSAASEAPVHEDDTPFDTVADDAAAAKEALGRRAAALVPEDGVVLLDIGTTVAQVARALRGRRVTVATASLAVVDVLRDDPGVDLIVLGGLLRRSYHSLVGNLTEDALRQVRADVAVLGTSGVTREGDVLDTTLAEVPIKRALVAAGRRSILVADADKFPGKGTLRVCGVADIGALVTNHGADPGTLTACTEAGTEVITV